MRLSHLLHRLQKPLTTKRQWQTAQDVLGHSLILTASAGFLGTAALIAAGPAGVIAAGALVAIGLAEHIWEKFSFVKRANLVKSAGLHDRTWVIARELASSFKQATGGKNLNIHIASDDNLRGNVFAARSGRQSAIIIGTDFILTRAMYAFSQNKRWQNPLRAFSGHMTAVLHHETAHLKRTSLPHSLQTALTRANMLLVPFIVMSSFLTPGVSLLAGLPVALVGCMVNFKLLHPMASRIEEYAADRHSIQQCGSASHLPHSIFSGNTPGLKAMLSGSHPQSWARYRAMVRCERQLTPAEREAGQISMDRIFAGMTGMPFATTELSVMTPPAKSAPTGTTLSP